MDTNLWRLVSREIGQNVYRRCLFVIFSLLATLLVACQPAPTAIFTDPNGGEGCILAVGGTSAEIPIRTNTDVRSMVVWSYPGSPEAVASLNQYFLHFFSPVEYTYFQGRYWYKVLIYDHIVYSQSTENYFPEEPTYGWIEFSESIPMDTQGCDNLPLTNDISLHNDSNERPVACYLRLTQDNVPARVGPGLDRAIRRYLNQPNINAYGIHPLDTGEGIVNWYLVLYEDERLWLNGEDGLESWNPDIPCELWQVAAPPPILAHASQSEDFEVYNCTHMGNNQFEWYSATVFYTADGTPQGEKITAGPFTGEWRPGCPTGETVIVEQPPPSISNEQPVSSPPTIAPPTSTPNAPP